MLQCGVLAGRTLAFQLHRQLHRQIVILSFSRYDDCRQYPPWLPDKMATIYRQKLNISVRYDTLLLMIDRQRTFCYSCASDE